MSKPPMYYLYDSIRLIQKTVFGVSANESFKIKSSPATVRLKGE